MDKIRFNYSNSFLKNKSIRFLQKNPFVSPKKKFRFSPYARAREETETVLAPGAPDAPSPTPNPSRGEGSLVTEMDHYAFPLRSLDFRSYHGVVRF